MYATIISPHSIQCELQSLKWQRYEAVLTDVRHNNTAENCKDDIASFSAGFDSAHDTDPKRSTNVRATAFRAEEKELENDVKKTRDRMQSQVERLLHLNFPCYVLIDSEKLTFWVFNVNEKHSFPTLDSPLSLTG